MSDATDSSIRPEGDGRLDVRLSVTLRVPLEYRARDAFGAVREGCLGRRSGRVVREEVADFVKEFPANPPPSTAGDHLRPFEPSSSSSGSRRRLVAAMESVLRDYESYLERSCDAEAERTRALSRRVEKEVGWMRTVYEQQRKKTGDDCAERSRQETSEVLASFVEQCLRSEEGVETISRPAALSIKMESVREGLAEASREKREGGTRSLIPLVDAFQRELSDLGSRVGARCSERLLDLTRR